ncbi:MAG: NAD(P)-dependent oxidoreductase [Paenibacillus macerans]|uniref:3-beta hydroxysteroid dehydrogenase/isomerase family protein n=1 Tax=Paenibacillus macerans TaxID=44252 RepID=A0A090Z9V7_PAEMA|nr:NAD(P)-dependent oxidoreductase [Paenibacillus macerans]KFN08049.1 3-beta hydroxysteroid dehydrogenase/isomerase family protein [Paenibacillus macerans]MCY7556808.1 NAD(P)-dependent oxidoreductase [Paenibacillus macerans]MDU7474992.1 NAD(P)-dependent oxidoreductase [Paenibacillus macerans]MEC0152044.1 NAD(P)-dependent oxidoreductase [Paenibacillus macerans]MEC0328497.1 NAD(P)-dependent oxidoreductase [Paenibacillus macerans]
MKVVVTGAAGKIGRWTVRTFLEAGHDVVASDRKLREESASKNFIQADLRDYGQVIQLLLGCDAVVHLGNIPTDVRNTPQAIFENNMIVNFNILEACKDLKIPKLVWASSETVLGYPFVPEELSYLPVDEEHPTLVKSSYAMAKALTEQLTGMFHKLTNAQLVSLRFANMYEPDEYEKIPILHWHDKEKDIQKKNAWAYCDVRDAATACLLAIEKNGLGHEVFHITAPDTIMPDPSRDLAEKYFPKVPLKKEIQGYETLMAIDKARKILGYEPRYSWRSILNLDGSTKAMPEDQLALSHTDI